METSEKYPLALPKGSVLAGQYIIEDVLGQGGFGITYKATDHKTGGNVAVKEFFPDTLAYREGTEVIAYPGERTENYEYGKESFLQEAQTLAQFIGNENIVRIHSYFEENGTAYFVMDFIEGISFDEYIKRKGGKISVLEAEQVLIPIMDALDAVHGKGIVHRDVTPDNIYICNDGTVKLLDFGAARYSLGDKSRSLDVILKHGFAPKEQYTRRGRQGPYTDIYSLAASFYFAITGKRPPDSVDRLDEDDLIPPSSLGVDITDYQEKALYQALEVQPQNRFQSMAVFKKVLLNEGKTAPVATVSEPVNSVVEPKQKNEAVTPTTASGDIPPTADKGVPAAQVKKGGGKKVGIAVAAVLAIAAIGAAVLTPSLLKKDDDDDDDDESSSVVAVDDSETPAVTTTKVDDLSLPDDLITTAPEVTTAPVTTQAPEVQKSGDLSVIGNYSRNINNDAVCVLGGNVNYWTDNSRTEMHSDSGLLFKGTNIYNLCYVDGLLFYIDDGRICFYDGDKNYYESGLESFSNAKRLYITADYFFIYDTSTLYRVRRSDYEKEETMNEIKGSDDFTINGGYLYFISTGKNGNPGVFRKPADNFASGGKGYSDSNGGYVFVIGDDNYIYDIRNTTNGHYIDRIAKSDFETKTPIYYDVSSVVPSGGWIQSMNVFDNTIIFDVMDSSKSHTLYYFNNSTQKFSIEKISSDAYSPYVEALNDGGFELSYMALEDNTYKNCYKDFDKNGQPKSNN